ncbi:hypothetical protein MUO15_09360 [Halobacillus amylolyticus]|uniref:DUF1146 domain-containing protein n=1 Tax=Halobacillus amylolyticus TaxID=2932259 RepID=A0ABY4HFG6_9BACI|nr:hypothetical protein MUO15_09360 [Halobacillus amylolyticus]
MVIFAEVLRAISYVILIISAGFFLRHLEKTKKQRKLLAFEFTMYIIIQIAFGLFGISFLISIFVD